MTQAVVQVRNIVARSGFANPLTLEVLVSDEDYLKVYADTTLLDNGPDYEVTGIGDPNGVSIEIIGAEDVDNYVGVLTFTALYDPPYDQQSDLSAGGVLGRGFETGLDQQNRRMQAQGDRLSRAIKLPVNVGGDIVLPTPVDQWGLIWDADTQTFVWAAITAAGAAAATLPSGGETGQVLVKASDDDFDAEWVEIDVDVNATPHVATRAALKALDTTEDTVAILTEEGREGVFVWRTGDYAARVTADTAEGVFVKATAIAAASGAWVRVFAGSLSAKWFGAVADATGSAGVGTDNITAFRAARALCKLLSVPLYIPGGGALGYRMTDTWNLDTTFAADWEMFGDGTTQTMIFFEFSSAKKGITLGDVTTFSPRHFRIHDIGFRAIGASPNNVLVHLELTKIGAPTIERVHHHYGTTGVYAFACYGIVMRSNECYGTHSIGHALVDGSAQGGVYADNDVYQCGLGDSTEGVLIDTAQYVTMNDSNNITECYIGVQFRSVGHASIDGNYIENNHVNFYWHPTYPSSFFDIQHNWFGGADAANVFENCTYITFQNNSVSGETWSVGSGATNLFVGNNNVIFGGSVPSLNSGTWTPVITFITPGNLSVTYSTQYGRWEKSGDKVTLSFRIITSTFTHTTASGNLVISGSPFTSRNVTGDVNVGQLTWAGITKANYTQMLARISENQSLINIIASGSGQAIAAIAVADVPSGGSLNITGSVEFLVA